MKVATHYGPVLLAFVLLDFVLLLFYALPSHSIVNSLRTEIVSLTLIALTAQSWSTHTHTNVEEKVTNEQIKGKASLRNILVMSK